LCGLKVSDYPLDTLHMVARGENRMYDWHK
jgi:hypothetical protein